MKKILERYRRKATSYNLKYKKLNKKLDTHERLMIIAREDLKKLRFPSWVDELIKPIAEEMVKYFPGREYRISGPFGLASCVTVFFERKDISEEKKDGDFLSIHFVPGDLIKAELFLRDYSKNTKEYANSTIGEINGFNHPLISIKENIQWLVKHVQ